MHQYQSSCIPGWTFFGASKISTLAPWRGDGGSSAKEFDRCHVFEYVNNMSVRVSTGMQQWCMGEGECYLPSA